MYEDDLRPGREALRQIQRLVRQRLARTAGGHLVESGLDRIALELRVDLDPARADPERFAQDLVERIDGAIDDAVQHVAAFRPGHAFCHRCGRTPCEHSKPPSARHVLVGYAPTGVPRWEEFAQMCLEARHPAVDRLFDPRPAFVTMVLDSAALHERLLAAFENERYELIGQLVAGFFAIPGGGEEGRGVVALTFQAAATRGRSGGRRLGLNILGRTPAGEDLSMLLERQDELPWRRSVRWAQHALGSVRCTTRGAGVGRMRNRVEGILRGLARRLEREQRARSRRTGHAQRRHASGERPTRKAMEDTLAARSSDVLVDERSGARVVLGDRGRTHFLSPDGRLVSSVRYSRDAIERKIRSGLWRPATPEEFEALGISSG